MITAVDTNILIDGYFRSDTFDKESLIGLEIA